mmetsp:Transcript_1721/g.2536  ORF Transcript_1721/g.2536 Transcript_1721/m.2536 type:complete len:1255 (-) Transcript_1721:466-4230(-)
MGVPAFYRWLSEKYPKIVQDVLEERVGLASNYGTVRMPFDATKPNPSGLETDNLYIDMNGIIHPCSHPENGPQPTSEEEMYENVCHYVDRLVRVVRPRKLLYLAIDGVAPRAKMNQQRARRFRSAQEAREAAGIEDKIRTHMTEHQMPLSDVIKKKGELPWDSNVITPGTTFMIGLAEFVRFYIRKRINSDPAWKDLKVIFSDASIPGEGEHKIMSHVRLQRTQPQYNPNLVHVLHGLDADLIMLALATHEAHFYILREEVVFGRKSMIDTERRREETGFTLEQQQLNEAVGSAAMELPENKNKPLQRLSIPILREYLANEFKWCHSLPFRGEVSFERLIDDIVFLCFFVGNDFLPHLPSLDIRDGALDFLFNIYKRLLPTLGGYITDHGGEVNLSRVDVILAEVGAIEDYVFQMKHDNEVTKKKRFERNQAQRAGRQRRGGTEVPPEEGVPEVKKSLGRAARILENRKGTDKNEKPNGNVSSSVGNKKDRKRNKKNTPPAAEEDKLVALGKDNTAKTKSTNKIQASHMNAKTSAVKSSEQNEKAAMELRASLMGAKKENDEDQSEEGNKSSHPPKRKAEDITPSDNGSDEFNGNCKNQEDSDNEEVEEVDAAEDEDEEEEEEEDDDEEEEELDQMAQDKATAIFKRKVQEAQRKQLDEYADNVKDNVELHKPGWKDRYYTDKCKADDVENHGGREHLFRSYIMGLCWVMKYYYDGVPSWKWYYPFHYAPFASDLRNIERFHSDCKSFEQSDPFKPVEQLLAVLPEDSSHAVPKEARWLMGDRESPIIDFYPKEVPCDPNGKAMPWLWVVLLPFIDEERLLAALKPTMLKWSKKELLCNARGLDDGYLFVHNSHPLATAALITLKAGKDKNTVKTPLSKLAPDVETGLAGSIRQPLSHETSLSGDDVVIPLPASASRINQDSSDSLFSEPIESNWSLCVAFTEPDKLPHQSILLRGAAVPAPILTDEDRRIRRPRLNYGGGTIANLGTGREGQSHQAGHGSMNISSYERDLAERNGRGSQMYQAGTRSWGSMEPTPKRSRHGNSNHVSGGRGHNMGHSQQYNAHMFQQSAGQNRSQNKGSNQTQSGQFGQYNTHDKWQPAGQQPRQQDAYNQHPQQYQQFHNSYSQQTRQQGYGNRGANAQSRRPGEGQRDQPHSQQREQNQAHSFRGQNQSQRSGYHNQQSNTSFSFNRQGQQRGPQYEAPQRGQQRGIQWEAPQRGQQQQNSNRPGINPSLMSSLRSQLASTLQQNRRNGAR